MLACTGLYLWRGRFGLRVPYDVHRIIGLAALPFLLMWALTAAGQVFWPDPPEPIRSAGPQSNRARFLDVDRVIAMRGSVLPGELTMVYVSPGQIVLRKRVPGDPDPYGYSYIVVDSSDGNVRQTYDARTFPAGWRVREALYAVHIGSPGGQALRAAYAAAGLAPPALFLTGFLMWLRKVKASAR